MALAMFVEMTERSTGTLDKTECYINIVQCTVVSQMNLSCTST